jgi:membrane protein DedA with SNARE-associated domain
VALAAVVENFFPPAPADLVITLAAFLSSRGATTAMTVFWVTWIANVAGAALVYLLALRLGSTFFKSGAGRRLMSPEAVVWVERNYVRWGLAGLIVARLLPGFRSFTAPFAGLMRLGWVRTLVPIAAASAAWYGALIFVAARLGQSWTSVEKLVHGLNRTMAAIAIIAAIAIAVWLIRRGRKKSSADLRAQITQELEAYPAFEAQVFTDPAVAAVVALLLETESAERALSPEELEAMTAHFRDRWHLAQAGATLTPDAAREIVRTLAPTERAGALRRVRHAFFGEKDLARREARIMERVARMLGVES